jgi:hypothetical protein
MNDYADILSHSRNDVRFALDEDNIFTQSSMINDSTVVQEKGYDFQKKRKEREQANAKASEQYQGDEDELPRKAPPARKKGTMCWVEVLPNSTERREKLEEVKETREPVSKETSNDDSARVKGMYSTRENMFNTKLMTSRHPLARSIEPVFNIQANCEGSDYAAAEQIVNATHETP